MADIRPKDLASETATPSPDDFFVYDGATGGTRKGPAANAFSMDYMAEGDDTKIFSAAERTKLTGIATGATANEADSYLLDATNHTNKKYRGVTSFRRSGGVPNDPDAGAANLSLFNTLSGGLTGWLELDDGTGDTYYFGRDDEGGNNQLLFTGGAGFVFAGSTIRNCYCRYASLDDGRMFEVFAGRQERTYIEGQTTQAWQQIDDCINFKLSGLVTFIDDEELSGIFQGVRIRRSNHTVLEHCNIKNRTRGCVEIIDSINSYVLNNTLKSDDDVLVIKTTFYPVDNVVASGNTILKGVGLCRCGSQIAFPITNVAATHNVINDSQLLRIGVINATFNGGSVDNFIIAHNTINQLSKLDSLIQITLDNPMTIKSVKVYDNKIKSDGSGNSEDENIMFVSATVGTVKNLEFNGLTYSAVGDTPKAFLGRFVGAGLQKIKLDRIEAPITNQGIRCDTGANAPVNLDLTIGEIDLRGGGCYRPFSATLDVGASIRVRDAILVDPNGTIHQQASRHIRSDRYAEVMLPSISTTTEVALQVLEHQAALLSLSIVTVSGIAASGTDYWTFEVSGGGKTGNHFTGAATQAGLTAKEETVYIAVSANGRSLAGGAPLFFKATPTGSPAALTGVVVRVEYLKMG